jgi:hypothetical protein
VAGYLPLSPFTTGPKFSRSGAESKGKSTQSSLKIKRYFRFYVTALKTLDFGEKNAKSRCPGNGR